MKLIRQYFGGVTQSQDEVPHDVAGVSVQYAHGVVVPPPSYAYDPSGGKPPQPSEYAPVFSLQPTVGEFVLQGTPLTLTIDADGNPAPTFQWQKGTSNINGETGKSMSIDAVTVDDAGSYKCKAANSEGTTTSDSVVVKIKQILTAMTPAFSAGTFTQTPSPTLEVPLSAGAVVISLTPLPAAQGANVLAPDITELSIDSSDPSTALTQVVSDDQASVTLLKAGDVGIVIQSGGVPLAFSIKITE